MASKERRFLEDSERERLAKEIQTREAFLSADEAEAASIATPTTAEPQRQQPKKKQKKETKPPMAKALSSDGDGLEDLVSALPSSFSSRFGEICWAQGGPGYGWWPSCIYDPRLIKAEDYGTRKEARKNLGRKHLVYFFQCGVTNNETPPFDLLPDSKIVPWHQGLVEGLYLGRTAKATGRHRFTLFKEALQAAILEDGKPQSRRLEWNSNQRAEGGGGGGTEQTPQANATTFLPSPIQLVASAKKKKKKQQQRSRSVSSGRQPRKRAHRNIDFCATAEGSSSITEATKAAPVEGKSNNGVDSSVATTPPHSNRERDHRGRYTPSQVQQHGASDGWGGFPQRTSHNAAIDGEAFAAPYPLPPPPFLSSSSSVVPDPMDHTTSAAAAADAPSTNRECCYCQIYFTERPANLGTCVGFIELPCLDCTFADARALILENLETDKFPHSEWRFVHPTLGPLSIRMEASNSNGPMIPYLQRGGGVNSSSGGTSYINHNMGDGSIGSPFKVSICQDPFSLITLASTSPSQSTSG